VNKVITTVAFIGTKTIKVKLRPGRYSYVCDPHHLLMHGSFSFKVR
jgi:plastocyanin